MKKYFYLATMLAACLLGTTSCKNEKPEAMTGSAPITFALGAVQANGSSISDGTTVDKLVFAIYDANGAIVPFEGNNITVREDVSFPTTETINLVKGQTYSIVFWAQSSQTQAYDIANFPAIAVNYAGANNDEARDAFYAVKDFTIQGSEAISVELTRPFAQINVGVTKADFEAAKGLNLNINQSAISISNAATGIDLKTGATTGNTSVAYSLANIPTEILRVDEDGDGVRESEYVYMSMSYILPADVDPTSKKATIDQVSIDMVDTNANTTVTVTEGLANVPVQSNWRTNILGQMLTSGINFYITIDPAYKGDIIYPEYTNLANMFAMGGNVTIYKDLIFEGQESLVIPTGSDVVLDMKGHKLINSVSGNRAITIQEGAKLTIKNGIFDNLAPAPANNVSNQGVFYNSGELIIENGIIGSDATMGNAIENRGNGNVTVNGGTFNVVTRRVPTPWAYVFNHRSTGTMTINNAYVNTEANGIFYTTHTNGYPTTGELIVNGGTYTLKGAADCPTFYMVCAERGTITLNAGKFTWYKGYPDVAVYQEIASGAVVNISTACERYGDDAWTNYAANIAAVNSGSSADLAAAFQSGASEITLGADIYGETTLTGNGGAHIGAIVDGQVFDGQNNTVYLDNAKGHTLDCVFYTTGGTIKNVTLGGQFRGIYMNNLSSDLYIDNVIIDNVGYTFNANVSANANDIVVSNSTLNGWTSYGKGDYEVTFTDCKFGKGTGAWNYAYLRPYTTTTLDGCEFEAGFTLDMSQLEANGEILTITNCTLAGVPISIANITDLLEDGNSIANIVMN